MPSASKWRRTDYWIRLPARLVLVVAFSVYATAKFAGAQFVVEGGTLDKPVADLSGLELTWVFFGYSPLYGNIVAAGQLVAAALLALDRTARLGAVVLLPMTVNIVAVNFGFGLDTQVVSSVLLALNLYLLASDLPAWKKCFWDDTAADPARPRLLGVPPAEIVQGAAFVAVACGLFWLFTGLMSGPAGGLSPVSGEWLVESVTVDGQRATDPAFGAGWRWVCFDPFGRLSVRTNRHTFDGRYTADSTGDGLTVRYDPEPLPPIYPYQSTADLGLSPAEAIRVGREGRADFQWPVEMAGTYRIEDDKLVVITRHNGTAVEWVLTPYKRPKW
jgi:hypothetical protein